MGESPYALPRMGPLIQSGGAFKLLDQATRVSLSAYIELAKKILKIYYSQFIPSSTSMTRLSPTESSSHTSLVIDALSNLADINPSLACEKILETKDEIDIAELNKFLGVEPATSFFGSMKCPKQGAFKSIISSYKKGKRYEEATLLQRLQKLADNKKVTDQQLYNKFLEFKPQFSDQRLVSRN